MHLGISRNGASQCRPEADNEELLPDQVLISILENVTRFGVLTSAALVNKRWMRVSTSKDMWAAKMPPLLSQACHLAPCLGAMQPWGRLFLRVYHANLLSRLGPDAAVQQLPHGLLPEGCWVATAQGGSGWAWEAPSIMDDADDGTGLYSKSETPYGCCPLVPCGPLSLPHPDCPEGGSPMQKGVHCPWSSPPGRQQHRWRGEAGEPDHSRGSRGCSQDPVGSDGKAGAAVPADPVGAMASSYRWCELVHVVDLVGKLGRMGLSEGSAAAFLDSCPPLSFSVLYASRRDCPSECEAKVWLGGRDLRHTPTEAPSDGQGAGAGGQPTQRNDGGADSAASSAGRLFSWSTGCVQPALGRWQRAECVLAGYPQGVRRAVVVLRGRDRRYWAGHYGAKLAVPLLHFLAPEDLMRQS